MTAMLVHACFGRRTLKILLPLAYMYHHNKRQKDVEVAQLPNNSESATTMQMLLKQSKDFQVSFAALVLWTYANVLTG